MFKVLIVTSKSDQHANHVIEKMNSRRVVSVRFNTDEMPTALKVAYNIADGHKVWCNSDKAGSLLFDPQEQLSVWYRKPFASRFDSTVKKPIAGFVMRETDAFVTDLVASLSAARWINHPEINRVASNKLSQLRLAHELGIRVPKTLVTNDPQSVVEFEESLQPDGMIYKTLSNPFIDQTATTFRSVYTSAVRLSPEKLRAVELSPCLFQEQIIKAYELRVTVIGERVFAARIYSQDQQETALDWRRHQDKINLRQEVVSLESGVEQICLEITKRLGLTFGAIDLIVTPKGEHVFVEINPNGQWLWKELLLGLPISEALIDELVR